MLTEQDLLSLDMFLSQINATGPAVFTLAHWRTRLSQEILTMRAERERIQQMIKDLPLVDKPVDDSNQGVV